MGRKSREKWERRLKAREEFQKKSGVDFGWISSWAGRASKNNLEKACLFIIQWGTYLVLFTPLIVIRTSFFPFVTPKTIFFRVMVEIILLAYIFLAISNPRYRPKINLLTVSIGLFLAILVLTSVTGINFERSFWSTYERMTGLFTFFHLFAFFIVLSSCFKTREDWEKILGVSIVVGVLLSIYVLFGDEISTRGGGTIGNTSFMAAYLLFDIFFALILLLAKRGSWQIFSGVSLAIMVPTLLISTGRGAILAFFSGLGLLVLGYLLFSQIKILKRLAWATILFLMILGINLAIFQPSFVKEKIEITLKEMKPRLVVWEKGLKGFQEKPWLGWGPENFPVVFLKYFNPCMFLNECGGEIWFDRTHNIIFDTLINSGLLGLVAYLSIFAIAIYSLLKIGKRVSQPKNIFLPVGMAVLLIVYFIQNLLVFDMINTYLMFFLSLAFVYFLTVERKEEIEINKGKTVNPLLAGVIVVVIILLLWYGNILPAQTAVAIVQMVGSTKVEDAVVYFQKSLNSPMEKYEPREQFVQKITQLAADPNQNREALKAGFELAEAEMEKSIKKNFLDFRSHLFLGRLYLDSYRLSGDRKKLDLAQKTLEKAIKLSPTNQQAFWHLAEVKLIQGETSAALSLLQTAIDLEPRLGRSHWYLAMAYKLTGDYQQAFKKIKEAEKAGYNWKKSLFELKRVIEIYQKLNNYSDLVSLYQEALQQYPQDPQLWTGLAEAYANLGQIEKAKEILEKLKDLQPDLSSQIEKFLKELEVY